MAVKIARLKEMSAREIADLPRSELRATYQNVRKIVNSRMNTFKKHGRESGIPSDLKGGLGSSVGLTDAMLVDDIMDAVVWLRKDISTLKGYSKKLEHRRQAMQESIPDIDLSTADKLDKFGDFMGEMQDRYGDLWLKSVSTPARDLYREAERLNIDPRALMKNFDYWEKHLSDLEKADPINTRSSRQLKPSEYARKLGLEKIGGGERKGWKRK